MKNNLPCGIVEDLLPSYVDGLTSEETNEAVREHLNGCENCREKYETMKAVENAEHAQAARQVDYLKTVRRSKRWGVLIAVLCTVLVIVMGVLVKEYEIGAPAAYHELSYSIQENQQGLEIFFSLADTAVEYPPQYAFKDYDVQVEDGRMQITAQIVRRSKLHDSDSYGFDVNFDGPPYGAVNEIYLCGELIWADGLSISPTTRALYKVITPYTGNAPALGDIANALDVRLDCGDYTNALQTSEEPYGWTLHFTRRYAPQEAALLDVQMKLKAEQMLALIGNVGVITWDYKDDSGRLHTQTVTLEEVNALLSELVEQYNTLYGTDWTARDSIKDYAESPAALEQLRRILQMVH